MKNLGVLISDLSLASRTCRELKLFVGGVSCDPWERGLRTCSLLSNGAKSCLNRNHLPGEKGHWVSCANFAGLRRIWCSAGHLIGRTWIRNHLAKNPKQPFLPREHAGWKKLNSGASTLRLKQKNNSIYNQQISDNQLLSIMTLLFFIINNLPTFLQKTTLIKTGGQHLPIYAE